MTKKHAEEDGRKQNMNFEIQEKIWIITWNLFIFSPSNLMSKGKIQKLDPMLVCIMFVFY